MNKELTNTTLKILGVIAALYLFLVGINGMSSAIKHMGAEVADSIFKTTSNPIIALFIGIFSTVLFQSSSTTTSLIVGMVSSGALSLAGAIPMVMGANIGTTGTIWLAGLLVSDGLPKGDTLRIAIAHSGVNLFMAATLLPFVHHIARWLSKIT